MNSIRYVTHFTRAQFSRDGRIHTESRCNHCGFRITAMPADSLDNEEQEHAGTCQGSEAEWPHCYIGAPKPD
jgi:hypothetical protein